MHRPFVVLVLLIAAFSQKSLLPLFSVADAASAANNSPFNVSPSFYFEKDESTMGDKYFQQYIPESEGLIVQKNKHIFFYNYLVEPNMRITELSFIPSVTIQRGIYWLFYDNSTSSSLTDIAVCHTQNLYSNRLGACDVVKSAPTDNIFVTNDNAVLFFVPNGGSSVIVWDIATSKRQEVSLPKAATLKSVQVEGTTNIVVFADYSVSIMMSYDVTAQKASVYQLSQPLSIELSLNSPCIAAGQDVICPVISVDNSSVYYIAYQSIARVWNAYPSVKGILHETSLDSRSASVLFMLSNTGMNLYNYQRHEISFSTDFPFDFSQIRGSPWTSANNIYFLIGTDVSSLRMYFYSSISNSWNVRDDSPDYELLYHDQDNDIVFLYNVESSTLLPDPIIAIIDPLTGDVISYVTRPTFATPKASCDNQVCFFYEEDDVATDSHDYFFYDIISKQWRSFPGYHAFYQSPTSSGDYLLLQFDTPTLVITNITTNGGSMGIRSRNISIPPVPFDKTPLWLVEDMVVVADNYTNYYIDFNTNATHVYSKEFYAEFRSISPNNRILLFNYNHQYYAVANRTSFFWRMRPFQFQPNSTVASPVVFPANNERGGETTMVAFRESYDDTTFYLYDMIEDKTSDFSFEYQFPSTDPQDRFTPLSMSNGRYVFFRTGHPDNFLFYDMQQKIHNFINVTKYGSSRTVSTTFAMETTNYIAVGTEKSVAVYEFCSRNNDCDDGSPYTIDSCDGTFCQHSILCYSDEGCSCPASSPNKCTDGRCVARLEECFSDLSNGCSWVCQDHSCGGIPENCPEYVTGSTPEIHALPLIVNIADNETSTIVVTSSKLEIVGTVTLPTGSLGIKDTRGLFYVQPVLQQGVKNVSLNGKDVVSVGISLTIVSNGTSVTNFDKPVNIKMQVSRDTSCESNPSSGLCLAYINTATNNWECEDKELTQDSSNPQTFEGQTSHFTTFAVLFDGSANTSYDICTKKKNSSSVKWIALGTVLGAIVVVGALIAVGTVMLKRKKNKRLRLLTRQKENSLL